MCDSVRGERIAWTKSARSVGFALLSSDTTARLPSTEKLISPTAGIICLCRLGGGRALGRGEAEDEISARETEF